MEAELLNNDGRADEALAMLESSVSRVDAIPGDSTFLCVRASITINKAMTIFNNPQSMEDMQKAQSYVMVRVLLVNYL
jgi:hypothetical protein